MTTGVKISALSTANRRSLLERATGFLGHYDSIGALLTAANTSKPATAVLLPGTYDCTGLSFPDGLTILGTGLSFDSLASPVFGNAPILAGRPNTGRANRFDGVVFDNGIVVDAQWCSFNRCGFIGANGITFDGNGAPYYNHVNDCWFRGQTGIAVEFTGSANRNTIQNSIIHLGTNGRGVEASAISTAYPLGIEITACSFEAIGGAAATVRSFVYGCFRNSRFVNNYVDASRPTFSDGAEYVFTRLARDNRVSAFNTFGDTLNIDLTGGAGGYGIQFDCPRQSLVTGADNTDLGTYAGVVREVVTISACANLTLPPAQWCYSGSLTITCDRAGGTTVSPPAGTINGGASLALANGEVWRFYLNFTGSATTAWLAKRLA